MTAGGTKWRWPAVASRHKVRCPAEPVALQVVQALLHSAPGPSWSHLPAQGPRSKPRMPGLSRFFTGPVEAALLVWALARTLFASVQLC